MPLRRHPTIVMGHGGGVFINTSGFSLIPEGVHIALTQVRPGDVIILRGEIGLHGVAIMSVRCTGQGPISNFVSVPGLCNTR